MCWTPGFIVVEIGMKSIINTFIIVLPQSGWARKTRAIMLTSLILISCIPYYIPGHDLFITSGGGEPRSDFAISLDLPLEISMLRSGPGEPPTPTTIHVRSILNLTSCPSYQPRSNFSIRNEMLKTGEPRSDTKWCRKCDTIVDDSVKRWNSCKV